MSLDTAGPLSAIATLLSGLGGGSPLLKSVTIGVPTSLDNQVAAYVALGGQRAKIVASGVIERQADYYVGLCYLIAGAPSSAELALGAALDAFLRAVFGDLTLGGLATRIDVDLNLAKDPKYQLVVGQEFRVYPCLLTLVQRDTYNVTP